MIVRTDPALLPNATRVRDPYLQDWLSRNAYLRDEQDVDPEASAGGGGAKVLAAEG